jgi:hypothetical protein
MTSKFYKYKFASHYEYMEVYSWETDYPRELQCKKHYTPAETLEAFFAHIAYAKSMENKPDQLSVCIADQDGEPVRYWHHEDTENELMNMVIDFVITTCINCESGKQHLEVIE